MNRLEFGMMIKDIRLSMEESQAGFARLLGWNNSQSVAMIENGKVPFPPDKVVRLCKIAPNLNVSDIINALSEVAKTEIKEKVYSSIKKRK